jgi:DNA-binding MarR family transcriptional regulator
MVTSKPRVDDRRRSLFLLSDTVRLLRAEFARRVPGFALTPALIRLLFYVQRVPGCRQVEIAEWLDISPVTVGRMIDRLEEQGLVCRESDPGDRRVSRVHLGKAAKPHMTRLNAYADRVTEQAFAGFSRQEYDALLVALGRVHDNLTTEASRIKRAKGGRHDR